MPGGLDAFVVLPCREGVPTVVDGGKPIVSRSGAATFVHGHCVRFPPGPTCRACDRLDPALVPPRDQRVAASVDRERGRPAMSARDRSCFPPTAASWANARPDRGPAAVQCLLVPDHNRVPSRIHPNTDGFIDEGRLGQDAPGGPVTICAAAGTLDELVPASLGVPRHERRSLRADRLGSRRVCQKGRAA